MASSNKDDKDLEDFLQAHPELKKLQYQEEEDVEFVDCDEDDGFEDDGFDDCPAWLEIPPGILFQCESLVTTKWLERYYCFRPPFSKFCSFSVRLAVKCKWVTAFPPKGRT